jgi:hypothetical protein
MSDDPAPAGPAAAVAGVPRIRVSDAERTDTVSRLQVALVEGRLDLAETDERVTAAFAARYHSDLQLLVADLPPQVPPSDAAPSWSAVWESAVWRAQLVVLGEETGVPTRPTVEQRRVAAALAGLALMWFLVCAFAGAAMVA